MFIIKCSWIPLQVPISKERYFTLLVLWTMCLYQHKMRSTPVNIIMHLYNKNIFKTFALSPADYANVTFESKFLREDQIYFQIAERQCFFLVWVCVCLCLLLFLFLRFSWSEISLEWIWNWERKSWWWNKMQ